jgi:hypothetical protein
VTQAAHYLREAQLLASAAPVGQYGGLVHRKAR